MRYSGIPTNERLRFVKCPVCGNDEFSYEAEFCRVCGSAIYNYCQDLYDENGYRVSNGCGRPNPGNARFCEYCGNPTLLFKYLGQWEEEKGHHEKYDDLDEDYYLNADQSLENEPEIILDQNEDNDKTDSTDSFEQAISADTDDLSHAFDEFLDEDEELEEESENEKK